ncbi:N,N-dimethylformamidase beta subunit family domain-containing protein [Mycolicibacterium sp. 050158]|uniref:N,N-dimethylformamidase beta subunit family domain-containing protein n=1 Tax=Mycolicibacterium sp. 050158 TaxID=3090602 RepID=UPI00299EAA62|nr:N,N-dimethylformamidase beta subunit family domain-containing protein [Mycolicibacterium sp. 050158]MDX1888041.1 DUF6605 domain-containing protein [Mycolicibacterium sp. 050158]
MNGKSSLQQKIYGYTDRFSARVGESLSLHVSCRDSDVYDVAVVRLHHGWEGSKGPGFIETLVPSDIDGQYPGTHYRCVPGSFVEIPERGELLASPLGLEISVAVYPTLRGGDQESSVGAYNISNASNTLTEASQAIMGNLDTENLRGWALSLDDGRPTFTYAAGGALQTVAMNRQLRNHHWYQLVLQVPTQAGEISFECTPLKTPTDLHVAAASGAVPESVRAHTDASFSPSSSAFRIGALAAPAEGRWVATASFNGKIGALSVDRATSEGHEQVARWHFGRSDRPDGLLLTHVVDESVNELHGTCVNSPVRAVTGPGHNGIVRDFRQSPDEYDAIMFHDDDITDADWPAALIFSVPETMDSGVYAFRLTVDGVDHHVPFFVGPNPSRRRDVAVLFPTGTYLAYANDSVSFQADAMENLLGHTPVVHIEDLSLQETPEFGRSLYEAHNDGYGVVLSSSRRPIVTMQPRYCYPFSIDAPWTLASDLFLVHWLETIGCEFDAITDEVLDREGSELLDQYSVVITGSHPEYVSRKELDALEAFTAGGGRLMYLGGNGFFATASFDPESSHVVEVRRASGGTRPHQTPFAEQHHANSGEAAGLWRDKGKAPDRLVGVGMSSQGFDHSTYYERLEDSFDPRAEFVFEGIGESERIGDFGIAGGGAAGCEVDFYNPALGSPPDTLLLATSGGFTDAYQLVVEEIFEMVAGIGGSEHPSVRSDIVYGALRGGGGFFAVGSIAWSAALSHNKYENNVARLTENVLRRFRDSEPLK